MIRIGAMHDTRTDREREREREKRKLGGVSERYYSIGGGIIETKFVVLKVPRQCPLFLLVEVRLVCEICTFRASSSLSQCVPLREQWAE
jgi:hypothetical protein